VLSEPDIQPQVVALAGAGVERPHVQHEADHDMARSFSRQEVLDIIVQAQRAYQDWHAV